MENNLKIFEKRLELLEKENVSALKEHNIASVDPNNIMRSRTYRLDMGYYLFGIRFYKRIVSYELEKQLYVFSSQKSISRDETTEAAVIYYYGFGDTDLSLIKHQLSYVKNNVSSRRAALISFVEENNRLLQIQTKSKYRRIFP
jgi:hypothetical protein